jgi:hypothetical protein
LGLPSRCFRLHAIHRHLPVDRIPPLPVAAPISSRSPQTERAGYSAPPGPWNLIVLRGRWRCANLTTTWNIIFAPVSRDPRCRSRGSHSGAPPPSQRAPSHVGCNRNDKPYRLSCASFPRDLNPACACLSRILSTLHTVVVVISCRLDRQHIFSSRGASWAEKDYFPRLLFEVFLRQFQVLRSELGTLLLVNRQQGADPRESPVGAAESIYGVEVHAW